ncbi:MAG: phosphoenolpyruvate carboxylase [Candidatus Promineifilaceae bacterium]|nr:phosphoenolpyruvate carboxylase [Candidatus Promineifilaceae bacterium]
MNSNQTLDRLSDDIHLLGDILGKVIRQQAGIEIYDLVERTRALSKTRRSDQDPALGDYLRQLVSRLTLDEAEGVARAFTTYFELINLAEENHRVRVLRRREREAYPNPPGESIAAAIGQLRADGVTSEQMAALLADLHIELVFTAHPTEAKRRSVLSKLRRIDDKLLLLERQDPLPSERAELEKEIRAEVTALWLTERGRTRKPHVTDEVRTGLHYFETSIWDVLPNIYEELAQALTEHYPSVTAPTRFLTFGSWIGGDRDGNPNVTTPVTAETLRLHRGLAVEHHRREAHRLARFLSLSRRLSPPGPALRRTLEQAEPTPHVDYLRQRYPREPYRIHAALLQADLAAASEDDVVARLQGEGAAPLPALRSGTELLQRLTDLSDSLRQNGADIIADVQVAPFEAQARLFGLHTARLDIRQYSDYHTAALSEILASLDRYDDYEGLDAAARTKLLTELLNEPIPDLDGLASLSDETHELLELFRLLARAVDYYGPQLIGPYIISMARGPADVLIVLLLGYWHGLCLREDGQAFLTIAPLFETRADLAQANESMATLFTHPIYGRHLADLDRHQTIMVGYSDSNKDAGYLAANWELFQAQERLAAVCRTHQVQLTLFHGRGGTVARGGGPVGRIIRAQPPGSIGGQLRVTEQGEVIDERYGHPAIARRHLEQVTHAVLLASAPDYAERHAPQAAWREMMDELAEVAYQAYREFIYETPDLLTYWMQATPIHEIGKLRIGSRPARRQSDDPFASLRAIPWNFSWMQSRHGLPGWYGLGHALEAFTHDDGKLADLQGMYRDWIFFRALIDNAQMALGKADMSIAGLYASLVEDVDLRQRIFGHIMGAHQRTCRQVLKVTGQQEILGNASTLRLSIARRNPYVDPLNFVQVDLLRRLRALPDEENDQAGELLEVIFLTINGIAAGLKNTG